VNVKKGGTFRATTATGGQGRPIAQVKHINANNFVPPTDRDLNTTG